MQFTYRKKAYRQQKAEKFHLRKLSDQVLKYPMGGARSYELLSSRPSEDA